MKIYIKKLDDNAIIPTQAHPGDAGWDLYAYKDYEIPPGETVKVGTGVAIALPKNTFGAIYARSGLATKNGLRPANCVGVCDESYRGEYIVPLYNDSKEYQYVQKGDRIAQMIVQNFVPVNAVEVDELPETERGSGGFGSTGN